MHYLSPVPGLPELWGTITLIGLLHFTSLLYIKKWTLRTTDEVGKAPRPTDTWFNAKMWTRMYKVSLNPRFVRVPYKDVVPVDQDTFAQVKSTAIHRSFSMTRVHWLLLKIGMLSLLNRLVTAELLGTISMSDFMPAKTVLLRRLLRLGIHQAANPVALKEIAVRIWFTVNAIWAPIILLDSIHVALTIFFIYVVRIDLRDDWPDLFGSPLEAFSLGGFWMSYVDHGF